MTLSSTLTKKATVIVKTETPYDVNGNKGVTYRLGILLDGDIEKVKCVNKQAFDLFQTGQEYFFTGQVDVRNGSMGEWKVSGFLNTK